MGREIDTNPRWWVVDCDGNRVVGPMWSERNAAEEAAVLNVEGLAEFRPYVTRAFNDGGDEGSADGVG